MLFVIYLKFSTCIPYQLDIFDQSVPQCLSFLITHLAFIILTDWFQFLMTSTDVISFPVFYPNDVSGCPKLIRFLISIGMQSKKGLQCCTAQWVKGNNSQTAHLRPALNRCFNLKPQEYIDNNSYVTSVFNFIMRHCHAIFSANLYETSNDQFKTLHRSLQFSNLCMPFTICLVFQDGQLSLVEVVLYCIIIF